MPDEVIENPTYMEHIRTFFEPIDLEHMKNVGIDISTYERSRERSQSFMNWIRNGHPLGVTARSTAQATATNSVDEQGLRGNA